MRLSVSSFQQEAMQMLQHDFQAAPPHRLLLHSKSAYFAS